MEVLKMSLRKEQNMRSEDKINGALAVVYGVLMFTRNPELSAVQRLITALCIRGRAEDMVQYIILYRNAKYHSYWYLLVLRLVV